MSEQLPPYDQEAEEATIGALLIDPDAMARVIATGLQPGDFHVMRLRLIYRAIMELHAREEPADYVLVLAELRRRSRLKDVGGPAGVTGLIVRCPTSIYAHYYATIVVERAQQRRSIARAARIAKAAYAGEDITDLVDGFSENSGKIKGVLR